MNFMSRTGFALEPTSASGAAAPMAPAPAQSAAKTQELQPTATSYAVDGEVLEVLANYALAHVRAADGSIFGLNPQTPGIRFADLHKGQRVRVEVVRKFNRVLHAQLLG